VKDVNCFLFFFFNGEVLLVISCGTGAVFFFSVWTCWSYGTGTVFQYWNCESMNYHCYKLWDKVVKITSCPVKSYDFTSQYILSC
jgi:hypothetical protein